MEDGDMRAHDVVSLAVIGAFFLSWTVVGDTSSPATQPAAQQLLSRLADPRLSDVARQSAQISAIAELLKQGETQLAIELLESSDRNHVMMSLKALEESEQPATDAVRSALIRALANHKNPVAGSETATVAKVLRRRLVEAIGKAFSLRVDAVNPNDLRHTELLIREAQQRLADNQAR